MRNITRFATIVCLLNVCGYAQQPTQSDREAIQQLLQQVRELQQRVQVLEAGRTTTVPTTTPVVTETLDSELQAIRDSPAFHELHGIQWRGFGEADYKVLNQRTPELGTYGFVPGSAGSFYTGDFTLLLTSRLTDKASVLSEIAFGEGDAQTFSVDLERVLFKYDYNDHLRMSFGRYHTGIGYYNTAYHSGSWLQTAADRPLIMEFANDGGILPTQAVGVSLTGEIPSGGIGLNYVAEYGSSDTIRPEINDSSFNDENNGNHINVGLFMRPASIAGLQIGGSLYHDRISDFERGPSVRLGQTIVNAHVVYAAHGIEFLNEGFLVRHSYEASPTIFNMPAFYSQFSKQIARYRPFIRYQYVNANQNSIFSDVLLRHGPSFGVRYDFNDFVAFKVQFDHMIRKDQLALDGLHLQLAFTF
jgi:hypothetical protein